MDPQMSPGASSSCLSPEETTQPPPPLSQLHSDLCLHPLRFLKHPQRLSGRQTLDMDREEDGA